MRFLAFLLSLGLLGACDSQAPEAHTWQLVARLTVDGEKFSNPVAMERGLVDRATCELALANLRNTSTWSKHSLTCEVEK